MIVIRLLFNITKRSQTNLKHAKFEFYAQICYTIRINQFLLLKIKKNQSKYPVSCKILHSKLVTYGKLNY